MSSTSSAGPQHAAVPHAPVWAHRPADPLPPLLRWGLRGGVVFAHVGLIWALLQVGAVRESVRQVAPIMVDWIAPPQPAAAPAPQPIPAPQPQSRPVVTPQRPAVLSAPPAPAAQQPAYTAPAADPVPADPAPAPAAAPAGPANPAPPAPPAGPKNIPSSAVRYLERPQPVYPRRSQDAGEAGTVTLRVLVDEHGLPRDVVVHKSSGYPRLDQAAVEAMRRARFQPYTENGLALPVWAPAAITFQPPED